MIDGLVADDWIAKALADLAGTSQREDDAATTAFGWYPA